MNVKINGMCARWEEREREMFFKAYSQGPADREAACTSISRRIAEHVEFCMLYVVCRLCTEQRTLLCSHCAQCSFPFFHYVVEIKSNTRSKWITICQFDRIVYYPWSWLRRAACAYAHCTMRKANVTQLNATISIILLWRPPTLHQSPIDLRCAGAIRKRLLVVIVGAHSIIECDRNRGGQMRINYTAATNGTSFWSLRRSFYAYRVGLCVLRARARIQIFQWQFGWEIYSILWQINWAKCTRVVRYIFKILNDNR